jgi:hypothetical protein
MENGKYNPNPNLQCIEVTEGQKDVLIWAADAMNDYWSQQETRQECGDNWYDQVVWCATKTDGPFWFIVEDIDVVHDLLYRIEQQRTDMNREALEGQQGGSGNPTPLWNVLDNRSIKALARKIRAEFKMVSPAGSQPVIDFVPLGDGWSFIYDDPGTQLRKDGDVVMIEERRVTEVEMLAFIRGWTAYQARHGQPG